MRVLVVDDSKAMRMIVIRTLRQADIQIDEIKEAADGKEGLEAVPEFKPDLILCDWNMPVMNGFEFLTALRETDQRTTFGFVTSESNPAMKEQALDGGANFLLTKPFNADRVNEVVGSLVR